MTGALAGSQSRPQRQATIDGTSLSANTSPICCTGIIMMMAASHYGQWARSRISGEVGAVLPACFSMEGRKGWPRPARVRHWPALSIAQSYS